MTNPYLMTYLHEYVAMLQIAKRTCVSVHSLLYSLDTRGERGERRREPRGRSDQGTKKICQGQDLLSSESY